MANSLPENKKVRTRTAVVCPVLSSTKFYPEARLSETLGLSAAIDLDVVWSEIVKLREIRAGTFFGKGIIERMAMIVAEKGAELMIIDADLTPIQQRNLEKEFNLKIIDRTALILEIFGERAQTKEGSLQVELAHLTYQRSRLVRSWTHLERQRGGAGFLGGPGETQIELDRRIIDDKIVKSQTKSMKVFDFAIFFMPRECLQGNSIAFRRSLLVHTFGTVRSHPHHRN